MTRYEAVLALAARHRLRFRLPDGSAIRLPTSDPGELARIRAACEAERQRRESERTP